MCLSSNSPITEPQKDAHCRIAGRASPGLAVPGSSSPSSYPFGRWPTELARCSGLISLTPLRTAMTRASAAASTPQLTIMRRPPVSTISIQPCASTGRDKDGEFSVASRNSGKDGNCRQRLAADTACANIAPLSTSTRRPSRARRRHENSCSPTPHAAVPSPISAAVHRSSPQRSAASLPMSNDAGRRRDHIEPRDLRHRR